ncbi:MAG: hypothetical protein ACSHX6_04505 [Akkermansiaceae bacterium]
MILRSPVYACNLQEQMVECTILQLPEAIMLNSLKTNLTDFLNKVGAITEDGTSYFKGLLGDLNLFTSSEALITENQLYDETHYLLVPDRETEAGFSLYTKRVLPEGHSTQNNLTKKRIFQLPNNESLEKLEHLLKQQISQNKLKELDTHSTTAHRLDIIAEEIDQKTNTITNGLLVIGGIVAVANPLLGVGIAAKALLPSLSSKLTSSGLDHFSSFLKNRKQKSAEKEANKTAEQEVQQLAPEITINPALQLLQKSLHTSDPNHDPLTESLDLWDDLQQVKQILIAAEAITTIYAIRVKNNNPSYLHPNDIAWIKSLKH